MRHPKPPMGDRSPVPYYEADGCVIYHGDCLTVLDALRLEPIHAVLMDPPYASGARTEAAKSRHGSMMRAPKWARPITNDQMSTGGFVWLIRGVLGMLNQWLVSGAGVLSFIDWRQWPNLLGAVESLNLRVNAMVVWDKGRMGMGNGFRLRHELVMHASPGVPRVLSRGYGNVLRYDRDFTTQHPSPKPIGLVSDLLRVVSGPGELVVDPFMGAGSTLVAARELGRRAIGIEIEERFCEIAAGRLRQGVLAR